jgi:beta-N-acetylhexosaminidase
LDGAEREALERLAPGAIVLFARNVSSLEATRTLVADARAACGGAHPALVCVDQEGGRVARLRFGRPLPSMSTLGATGDAMLAQRAGAALAFELRRIGATVDFAPVLDLALAEGSTVIGTRSLGAEPRRVAELGAALARGLQAGGVTATPKHFPGHGATALDSHVEVPVVEASIATLRERELVPFAAAFAAGARAVMSAHVVVRALDADRPATLSPAVLTGLLRGELGFLGACFTDDLQMDAIARGAGTTRGAVLALAAGADVLLVSHDLAVAAAARDAVVDAVRAGDVPPARLEEAAARVAALRAAQPDGETSASEDAGLGLEIAQRGLLRVRGEARLDRDRPVTVVSFEGGAGDGIAAAGAERPSLSLALRRRRVKSESMRVLPAPAPDMVDALLDVLRAQGSRDVVVLARRAHLHAEQRHAIDALLEVAPNAIVVSALEPFDVPHFGRARTLFATHGDEEPNLEALAGALLDGAR